VIRETVFSQKSIERVRNGGNGRGRGQFFGTDGPRSTDDVADNRKTSGRWFAAPGRSAIFEFPRKKTSG